MSVFESIAEKQKDANLIFSRNVEETICINVEGDLNLWIPAGCWRNAAEVKSSQEVIVFCHRAFALKYLSNGQNNGKPAW